MAFAPASWRRLWQVIKLVLGTLTTDATHSVMSSVACGIFPHEEMFEQGTAGEESLKDSIFINVGR